MLQGPHQTDEDKNKDLCQAVNGELIYLCNKSLLCLQANFNCFVKL